MSDEKKQIPVVEARSDTTISNASKEHDEYNRDDQSHKNVDYSGAQEKTDPVEIALVKKLDRWIMVSDQHSDLEPLSDSS